MTHGQASYSPADLQQGPSSEPSRASSVLSKGPMQKRYAILHEPGSCMSWDYPYCAKFALFSWIMNRVLPAAITAGRKKTRTNIEARAAIDADLPSQSAHWSSR